MMGSCWVARKRQIEIGEGRSIACIDTGGPGRVAVLVHGFTDSSRSFSVLEPHLHGIRLIMPDLRGHGASHQSCSSYQIADFAEDIGRLLDALALRDVLLVGHSLGAMVALKLAAERPDLASALVFIAGAVSPRLADEHPISRDVAKLHDPIDPGADFFGRWHACNRPVRKEFRAKLAREAAAIPAALWQSVFEEIRSADLRNNATEIWQPSLIIHGSADPFFDFTQAEKLHDLICFSELVRFCGCGHNPHWEEPKRVAALIQEFAGRFTRDLDRAMPCALAEDPV